MNDRRGAVARARAALLHSPALCLALSVAPLACGDGEAREIPSAAPSATAAASSSAGASTVAPPSATSATSAEPAPPAAAPSARPSARFTRPPGVDPARWQRIFERYGHLLDIEDILADYHHRYPSKTEVVTLGTTHEGRPVRALLIADDPAKARSRPSVLLNGAHHGDEPLSSQIVLDAVETLLARSDSDPRVQRYLAELAIWCVPLVNPDGFAAFMLDFGAGRKNGRETRGKKGNQSLAARGVDLNRNYPFRWGGLGEQGSRSLPDHRFFRGPEQASEPETRAMVALSDREHFVASISYHIGTVALLAPYTIDGVPNPTPNEAWLVAEEVVRKLPPHPDKPHRVIKNLYPVDGTDQDYHRFAHGTVALLFEAASRSWDSAALEDKTIAAVRPAWGALFDRYLDGPSVEGRVRDAEGRPAAADVQIVEMKARARETWRSRCPDGFFGRFLPRFGKFTVRVTPAGGAAVDTVVEVEATPGKGRVAVDIVVPRGEGSSCP